MSDHSTPSWLPPLMPFEDFGGDWPRYLEALYAVFRSNFCGRLPDFQGRPLALKRHPLSQGKEATFWHFIQEGEVEDDRTPDLRRCERIRWPRPVIEAHADSGRVRLWCERRSARGRGQEGRWQLALPDFSYLVVLADRGRFLLPWTAYHLERPHERRKLEQRWQISQKEGL